MSSHPNIYVAAVYTLPEYTDIPEEIDISGELYDVTTEGSEIGIDINENESFAIYEYLTYGWAESINLHDLNNRVHEFALKAAEVSAQLAAPFTIRIGANFW